MDWLVPLAAKSVVIAGGALLLLRLLKNRSAADRSWIAHLALAGLFLLPVATFALPTFDVAGPEFLVGKAEIQSPSSAVLPVAAATPGPASQAAPVSDEASIGSTPVDWPFWGYTVPAALLILLTLIALARLFILKARATVLVDAPWLTALARAQLRMGFKHGTALLTSNELPSPISWGVVRPVILLNAEAAESHDDAEAIITHELAHVARLDWAKLLLSRVAVALFWFNPLVWLLERALVQQAEEAADLRALGGVEPVSYARTLVACGAHAGGHAVPANSIAGQGLARRVRAVLDEKRRGTPSGSGWTGLAMLLCVAISAPIAAIELVSPKAPKPPSAPAAPRAPLAPVAPTAPAAPAAPVEPDAWADDEDIADAVDRAIETAELSDEQIDAIEEAAEAAAEAAADRAEVIAEAEVARVEAEQARIEADQARIEADEARAEADRARAEAGRVRSTADQARVEAGRIRAAAAQARVEADRARIEARAASIASAQAVAKASASASARAVARTQAGPLTADDLIAMKIQGVDARYLSELAALAPRIRLSAKEIVATKIQGLTPARLREFADAGYASTDIDDLVAMRIHGVTPAFIREMSAVGYPKLSPDDLVALRIHGVTADTARRAATQGRRPSPEELVEMKLRGKI